MGSGALDSHAKGKKHGDLVKSGTSAVDSYFYKKEKDKTKSTNLFQSKSTLSRTITSSFSASSTETNVACSTSYKDQITALTKGHTDNFLVKESVTKCYGYKMCYVPQLIPFI